MAYAPLALNWLPQISLIKALGAQPHDKEVHQHGNCKDACLDREVGGLPHSRARSK